MALKALHAAWGVDRSRDENRWQRPYARKLPIQREKEQAPFSPGESAPADRALVSVELLGVWTHPVRVSILWSLYFVDKRQVGSGELATVTLA
jgi:hypothetical protein